MTIDRKQPNPMKCSNDIATFNKIQQEQRLYQLLIGKDENFEVIKRDLLMQEKTPLLESAYAAIRMKAARLQILKPTTSSEGNTLLGKLEIGLTARNRPPGQGHGWSCLETAGQRPSQRDKKDKSHLHSTHCEMKKQINETCFKIVGYPNGGKILNQKITRLPLPLASHRPPVVAVVTPEERKKQNRKSFMEEPRSLMEEKKKRRIPA